MLPYFFKTNFGSKAFSVSPFCTDSNHSLQMTEEETNISHFIVSLPLFKNGENTQCFCSTSLFYGCGHPLQKGWNNYQKSLPALTEALINTPHIPLTHAEQRGKIKAHQNPPIFWRRLFSPANQTKLNAELRLPRPRAGRFVALNTSQIHWMHCDRENKTWAPFKVCHDQICVSSKAGKLWHPTNSSGNSLWKRTVKY